MHDSAWPDYRKDSKLNVESPGSRAHLSENGYHCVGFNLLGRRLGLNLLKQVGAGSLKSRCWPLWLESLGGVGASG